LDAPITEEKLESIANACTFNNMKKTMTTQGDMGSKQLAMNIMRKGSLKI